MIIFMAHNFSSCSQAAQLFCCMEIYQVTLVELIFHLICGEVWDMWCDSKSKRMHATAFYEWREKQCSARTNRGEERAYDDEMMIQSMQTTGNLKSKNNFIFNSFTWGFLGKKVKKYCIPSCLSSLTRFGKRKNYFDLHRHRSWSIKNSWHEKFISQPSAHMCTRWKGSKNRSTLSAECLSLSTSIIIAELLLHSASLSTHYHYSHIQSSSMEKIPKLHILSASLSARIIIFSSHSRHYRACCEHQCESSLSVSGSWPILALCDHSLSLQHVIRFIYIEPWHQSDIQTSFDANLFLFPFDNGLRRWEGGKVDEVNMKIDSPRSEWIGKKIVWVRGRANIIIDLCVPALNVY